MSVYSATSPTHVGTESISKRFVDWLRYGYYRDSGKRSRAYAVLLVVTVTLVWLPVIAFLSIHTPIYKSEWMLIIPGSDAGHAVTLDNVGQASATANSPFSNSAVDPKANYKALAESTTVLQKAASSAGMSLSEFGKPRIKLTDQTALMEFSITGLNPKRAKEKSDALYHALQTELERLRNDELSSRSIAVDSMLMEFNEKLAKAEDEVLDYQSHSTILSVEQFNVVVQNFETIRGKLDTTVIEHANILGELSSLQSTLGISPSEARDHLILQQDPLFKELSAQWAATYSVYTKHGAIWGAQHEKVRAAKDEEANLRHRLSKRVKEISPTLFKASKNSIFKTLSDTSLYLDLIRLTNQSIGKQNEIGQLRESLASAEGRSILAATDATELQNLKRKQQVATAVFTTALAKVDIGKSDRYGSYPLIQLLAEPSVPESPDTFATNCALLGGLIGSFFCILGVITLWIRKPFARKLLKNASSGTQSD